MSESAGGKWEIRPAITGGFRDCLVKGQTVYRGKAIEWLVNSLETSLAEVQKERDDANDDYKCLREEIARLAAYWDLDASRTEVVEEIIRRTRTLDERYGEQIDRAQAAEQQLAEVKAQLGAQAGVIKELVEALEKIAHGALHPDRYYLMEIAAAALAQLDALPPLNGTS